ncbi:MAG: hypothetical protein H0W97_05105 [Actinobacteria bacterium]|nr:hypothetical protein [Actinomycetota bacterium]
MPEVQEVFQMATQKIQPDPDALERQHLGQRRQVAKQKVAVFALIAALGVGAAVFGISALRSDDSTRLPGSTVAPTTIPTVTAGRLEPGTYALRTLDSDFDASHRITIEVPDGYEGTDVGVSKLGRTGQMSVAAWIIGDVYGDPCRWRSTSLDPPPTSSVDALVSALASQRGVRTAAPTDVTVDGYAAKSLERKVPAGTNPADCDGGEFRPWLGTDGGRRYLETGQRDRLWIVDVDGVPLVIDASLGGAGTSAEDRAAHIQIVESVQIDPR